MTDEGDSRRQNAFFGEQLSAAHVVCETSVVPVQDCHAGWWARFPQLHCTVCRLCGLRTSFVGYPDPKKIGNQNLSNEILT